MIGSTGQREYLVTSQGEDVHPLKLVDCLGALPLSLAAVKLSQTQLTQRLICDRVAESLAELQLAGKPQFNPSHEGQPTIASRRQLRQIFQDPIVPPTASIGVSTSGDLSCNGCGPDNRVQVTATTTYPFMTVGQLIGQLGTSSV